MCLFNGSNLYTINMEKYAAVNRFLDHLGPVDNQLFDKWWQQQWRPHQQKCMDAAKNVYVVERAVATGGTLHNMRNTIKYCCTEVGLDYDEFMGDGWQHVKKKWEDSRKKKINGDE